MKRVVLVSLIIFVFTFAFSVSLMAAGMAAGYGRDNIDSGKPTLYISTNTNDLTSMEKEAQKLVGQSKDQLIMQMGKPEAVYSDRGNGQIYSYRIRLTTEGPSKPHWLNEDFIVNTNDVVVRVSTSTS